MDYLQYLRNVAIKLVEFINVLNLVINGLPSIPYAEERFLYPIIAGVLNLVINGLPSILYKK